MTDQEPRRPRWLTTRTPQAALLVAIGYTILFVAFVAMAVAGGSVWNVLLAIVAAALSVGGWATVAYYTRQH